MSIPLTLNYWLLQTIAMMLTAALIPKLRITSIFGALMTVVALAFVNATIWDAALFFSLPQVFTVQAMLLLVTNGTIFWILVKLLPGIEVDGIWPALVAPLVFSVCSIFISHYGKYIDWSAIIDFTIGFFMQLKEHFYQTAPPQPMSTPIPTP